MKENLDKLEKILDKYNLNCDEKDLVKKIILPIFKHQEFQRRMAKEFMHHSDITLGEHILEDTIVTYLLSKRYLNRPNFNLEIALIISMLHDLYTIPWQNSEYKTKYFFNMHGFRHPVEAVINAISWYPELFSNMKNSEIIIDGILHHMYPLPVRRLSDKKMELCNKNLLDEISLDYLEIIKKSTSRGRIGSISLSRSRYKEGRIMSKADKKVSIGQIKNYESMKALLTGKNKSIEELNNSDKVNL